MKKILFVINTLGGAGAETALIELLNNLDTNKYEVSLYVLLGQGELLGRLPPKLILLNKSFNVSSVLSKEGRRALMRSVSRTFLKNGHLLHKIAVLIKNTVSAIKNGRVQIDKILWRPIAEGGERFEQTYDLAVAYIEGGAAYYVADYVKARKKAVFVHIDYENSGYTKIMDRDCYEKMDKIFTVSDEVREHFLCVYPEYSKKTKVFHNIINRESILKRAQEKGGPADDYDGIRLLTVGRLTYQKGYDIAVDAMALIKAAGYRVRWYVLGEGSERAALEKKIARLNLKKDFFLVGAVKNPFPWYAGTDIYVHATRFEGKSIAIQEAQVLGRAIVASDCNGNREQIICGVDGLLCPLTPEGIKEAVIELINDADKRKRLAAAAAKKQTVQQDMTGLLELAEASVGKK